MDIFSMLPLCLSLVGALCMIPQPVFCEYADVLLSYTFAKMPSHCFVVSSNPIYSPLFTR